VPQKNLNKTQYLSGSNRQWKADEMH